MINTLMDSTRVSINVYLKRLLTIHLVTVSFTYQRHVKIE